MQITNQVEDHLKRERLMGLLPDSKSLTIFQ